MILKKYKKKSYMVITNWIRQDVKDYALKYIFWHKLVADSTIRTKFHYLNEWHFLCQSLFKILVYIQLFHMLCLPLPRSKHVIKRIVTNTLSETQNIAKSVTFIISNMYLLIHQLIIFWGQHWQKKVLELFTFNTLLTSYWCIHKKLKFI